MSDKILSWIKPYPELDGDLVFCKAYGKIVSTEKKTTFLFSYSKEEFKRISFNYF